ncbi:MAG: phosphatidic acid phosphatase, partial [Bacteroidota bacterium]
MKNTLVLFGSLLVGSLLWTACGNVVAPEVYQAEAAKPAFYHKAQKDLTDIMVHDIFSPPVASRVYTYCNLAAYEALQPGYPQYRSLAGQLTDFPEVPKPDMSQEINFPLASMQAFLKMKRK